MRSGPTGAAPKIPWGMPQPVPPLDPRLTEQRNPATAEIDLASPLEIVAMMNAQDRLVPEAVHAGRHDIARAIEGVEGAFRAGGRLLYWGARTPGPLRVPDAPQGPPPFRPPPAPGGGLPPRGLPPL